MLGSDGIVGSCIELPGNRGGFLLTTTLEALTEEKKSWLVMLTDVMNELAIFGNWHWLLQILPSALPILQVA